MIYRIYTEKKAAYAVEAAGLLADMRDNLSIPALTGLRLLNRYDVEGLSEEQFAACIPVVFAEPPVDTVYRELPPAQHMLAVEYLPGQFDQRANSCAECIQFVVGGSRPLVHSAKVYLLSGDLSDGDLEKIRRHLINPVESRPADLAMPMTLRQDYPQPDPVEILAGFRDMTEEDLPRLIAERGLAMDEADLAMCREYFREEGRDPSLAELKMIDTYWSDHCRHTTFGAHIAPPEIEDPQVLAGYQRYCRLKKEMGWEKPLTLMDLATFGARYLRAVGKLKDLDVSEEINACTVKVEVDVDGEKQPWLLLFKNETHNHPTEIEPFGGAATCIGGAIRDPLSGRGYVYQAMRLTGAADPTQPLDTTLPGKLPQRKITTTAAAGYSSYGNQIGLPTGLVDEVYHPGYVAKRMEVGAVIAAAPAVNVRRERPQPGDVVVLLGGRTGRDGIGGATGSSKSHSVSSLTSCGAEVQKGNAPEERKLQRLFRNPQAASLIKRCNDFGAGGVSVAIGELAPGLDIDLDRVPKKYEGLDGCELAISESQERMAVVLDAGDLQQFLQLAAEENLEATPVAWVKEEPRLTMTWRGQVVADIARRFLDSNGAVKYSQAKVKAALPFRKAAASSLARGMADLAGDLNGCSKQGLSERFDSTVGAQTVLYPFGGKRQATPIQAMAAKLPVLDGETDSCSFMAYGFNPQISEKDPYRGGYLAVVESVSKLAAAGADLSRCWLSFQEYFPKLGKDGSRWGMPLASLLGALNAQLDLSLASIGGKDSMSGSFEEIDVPPTLISFAVAMGDCSRVCSPEWKRAGSPLVWLKPEYDADGLPEKDSLLAVYRQVAQEIQAGQVLAAYTPAYGGVAGGLMKMALGNGLGCRLDPELSLAELFDYSYGSFILELREEVPGLGQPLGTVIPQYVLQYGTETVDLAEIEKIYDGKLAKVFPVRTPQREETPPTLGYTQKQVFVKKGGAVARPRVTIPVFPGTNCEYDTAAAFRRAGGDPRLVIVRNLTPEMLAESVTALAKAIDESQILMLPGGFSGGDEPDGSGKFITAFFRNPAVAESIQRLLEQRDGLIGGICNGFQALIKLGLVPFGEIRDAQADSPTLTFNTVGRHQSRLIRSRVASVKSPWMSLDQVGDIYTVAISHGEGRFVCPMPLLRQLAENGQVAAQYVDENGAPSMDIAANPNGSLWAVEALTSPDGRVFGRMGHPERAARHCLQNVPGQKDVKMFAGAVAYFA
ncbi:MAG: phosphoribosylformylglycinamidine synthase [Firmicutes bacterium]|nr:phosphoribosylformylglycinamidine synthase [Bacillota bacterium]